jgi:peptidoglycan/LPS O-acetylase OafA/YrhL
LGRTITQAGEIRSARLESIRAIAALGVLTGHIYGQSRHYAPAATLDSFGHRILFGGGFGVFLFFALTGYLLFWPFARQSFGAGTPIDLRRYAVNRAVRILPLYVATVVILMIVHEGGGTGSQWWRFLTFSENFSSRTIGTVDGPMWSLVVEIHFYLLLPLLAWGLAKIGRGSKGAAAVALMGLAVLSYFVRRHAVGVVHRPLLEFSLPAGFMYFVPGMLLALLRLHCEQKPPKWLRGPLASSDAWLAGAVVFTVLQFRDYGSLSLIAVASFLAVGACVLPIRPGRLVRALDWRPLAVVGIASYSLYIWHDPIVIRLATLHGIPHSYPAQLVIAGTVCVAVALVSYRLIEAPFLKLRRQWSPASAQVGAGRLEHPAAEGAATAIVSSTRPA